MIRFSPESCEFIVVKLFSITYDILYETIITNDHRGYWQMQIVFDLPQRCRDNLILFTVFE